MRILVATPFMSQHFDAGLFWARVMTNHGHSVYLWDYRLQPSMPHVVPDLTVVFKGESINPDRLPHPRFNYFPDWFSRFPGIEDQLKEYDKVFTPVCPTPSWAVWLPSGWDPDVHRDLQLPRVKEAFYIGTANSQYKIDMVKGIDPFYIFGNGWDAVKEWANVASDRMSRIINPPVYLHEFVHAANQAGLLIDIHQEKTIGLNRKCFEMAACGPTIYDNVPGIEDVFGDLAPEIVFKSVEAARIKIRLLLEDDKKRAEIWAREREAIRNYTYERCLDKMLRFL
jgi:hypothetical protein